VPLQSGNSGGALVDERGNVVGVVSAKLDAAVALAASGALPENVNYAVKSSFLLSFLESAPEVSAELKDVNSKEIKFEEVVERECVEQMNAAGWSKAPSRQTLPAQSMTIWSILKHGRNITPMRSWTAAGSRAPRRFSRARGKGERRTSDGERETFWGPADIVGL
jgi:hypothetical protein